MIKVVPARPDYGPTAARKNGRDHQGRQTWQCLGCRRRFAARSGTPFAGYRCPPDVIALAVRRLRPMRGRKTLAGARAPRCAHAFPRNPCRRCEEFGEAPATATTPAGAPLPPARDLLTAELLARQGEARRSPTLHPDWQHASDRTAQPTGTWWYGREEHPRRSTLADLQTVPVGV